MLDFLKLIYYSNFMKDIQVLRELAKRYSEISALPVQEEKRQLWTAHFGMQTTTVPVLVNYGMWNVWCREVFGDQKMQCEDGFYRAYERWLKMQIFHYEMVGDDFIQEPWITLEATKTRHGETDWGVDYSLVGSDGKGGSGRFNPPIKKWSDIEKLRPITHYIDEEKTKKDYNRLAEVIGDILTINIDRTPVFTGFGSDISTVITRLRGLEQLMIDMYENPAELHNLLAFMRDAILKNNQDAEQQGHYTLTSGTNQSMPYAPELPARRPNSEPVKRSALWGFCAAQEFTLISPQFHEEFLLRYQLPIYENFGLVHYGCCEDLTNKIGLFKNWKNLRSIAVTPVANVRKCAEQIGTTYVISWRPNPADVICCGFNEGKIRKIISKGIEDLAGTYYHIQLKDIETLEGDVSRLQRWVDIVRGLTNR